MREKLSLNELQKCLSTVAGLFMLPSLYVCLAKEIMVTGEDSNPYLKSSKENAYSKFLPDNILLPLEGAQSSLHGGGSGVILGCMAISACIRCLFSYVCMFMFSFVSGALLSR